MSFEEKQEGWRAANEKIANEHAFRTLLEEYDGLFEQVRNLKRSERAGFDEKFQAKIQALDRKRHQKHLELLAAGMKLGKDASDVLVDIIREHGSLAEYGLPEFSILDWQGDEASRISEYECVLLYDVSPVRYDEDETTHEIEVPDDYRVRQARAAALAERVHGKLENDYNSRYFHSASQLFLGVIIPKGSLEEVASVIRDEPEKYRFGAEFYSPEEEALIEKFKAQKKEGWIDEKPLLHGYES